MVSGFKMWVFSSPFMLLVESCLISDHFCPYGVYNMVFTLWSEQIIFLTFRATSHSLEHPQDTMKSGIWIVSYSMNSRSSVWVSAASAFTQHITYVHLFLQIKTWPQFLPETKQRRSRRRPQLLMSPLTTTAKSSENKGKKTCQGV